MKRTTPSPAPWFLARRNREVYCRRDNRIYASCPLRESATECPCLHACETADALFEPGDEVEPLS